MAIYIKGVDIPTNCTDCRYRPLVGCNPYQDNGLSPSDHRHRTCPLMEVSEPTGDLISRADAIELCAEAQGRASTKSELKGISKVWQGLLKLPSAEAVQGEWGHMIADGADGSHWYEYECSHCGEVVLRPYNYCPNCGASMYREDGEV